MAEGSALVPEMVQREVQEAWQDQVQVAAVEVGLPQGRLVVVLGFGFDLGALRNLLVITPTVVHFTDKQKLF